MKLFPQGTHSCFRCLCCYHANADSALEKCHTDAQKNRAEGRRKRGFLITSGRSWNWSVTGDDDVRGIEIYGVWESVAAGIETWKKMTYFRMTQQPTVNDDFTSSPSPHSRWRASPHGRWRRYPAWWRQPAGGRTYGGSQHSRDCDLLTINLTCKENSYNAIFNMNKYKCQALVSQTSEHTPSPPSMCLRAFSASSGVSYSM